jgi:hypothetical protein
MTRITEKQFINQFANGEGIDIKDLSEGTRAILEQTGVLSELTDIAGQDGKIKGSKELAKLFKVVDSFDKNGSSNSFERRSGEAPTRSAVVNDALLHDFNQNINRARMKGPNTAPLKSSEIQALPTHAKVINRSALKAEFDFGRPITQEQAAKLIFRDGKVPEGSKLVQGPGQNSWTAQSSDAQARQQMLAHMRAHSETIDRSKPDEFTITWPEGPQKTSTITNHKELNNDLGFKIARSYKLDAGQHWSTGSGYELKFDKPMTKAQVMETLFNKTKLESDDVKLIPADKEPTNTWQVQVTTGGFVKMNPDVSAIFSDATANTKESIAPDVPSSIRTQLENRAIPDNAVAYPKGKSHPPGAYVWEQDGYLVYVVTDGKGKNGIYDSQVLKLNSDKDSQFNKDMRYYMKEYGMPPKMAVAAYNQQWEELNRMMITGFAMALSSASPGGRNPAAEFEQFEKDMMINWRAARKGTPHETAAPRISPSEPRPVTDIGNADTMPAMKQTVDTVPPPSKQPADIGNADTLPAPGTQKPLSANDARILEIQTEHGLEKVTVAEVKRRQDAAIEWRNTEARRLSELTENTDYYRSPASFWKELSSEAQKRFGLPEGWEIL